MSGRPAAAHANVSVTPSKGAGLTASKVSYVRAARVAAPYVASVTAGIVIWHLASLRTIPFILPSPADVAGTIFHMWGTGELVQNVADSSKRILTGWAVGILFGIPAGLVMGWFTVVRRVLEPYVEFLRFIPPIAFISLAIIYFGIGETSKVVLIFYTTVFIVTLNTTAGVVAVDEVKLRAAACLGASRVRTLTSVVVPAAVPYMVTGARIAMGNSFMTIVSAEFVAAESGIGNLIWQARNVARTDAVFAGIIILGLMGFVADRTLRLAAAMVLRRYGVKT
ncbi:MAG: ABC transporter permease [Chloroflexota bacterium]|nr:ABC transporter permease [Chloroflexota bacterium]